MQVFGRNKWLWLIPIIGKSGRPEGDGVMWRHEQTHPDDEIPNNESDRRAATLAGNNPGLLGSSARGGFPLADTAPAARKK